MGADTGPMQQTSLSVLAQAAAKEHDIPAALILGVIHVESGGNEYSSRFERLYRWCVNVHTMKPFAATTAQAKQATAPDGFPGTDAPHGGYFSSADTEWVQQKTSWGVMQIMGAVAREHGYTGPLPELCQAHIGIKYGCLHLSRLRDRFFARHGWAGTLDAYNDGTARIERHPDYPDKVAAVSPTARALIYPNGENA
ncbi:hypothetical protein C27AD_10151 [Salinisphaera hydrothermalis C27AD]